MNTATDIIAAYNTLREQYAEHAAESRACGYEVAPFEEWAGQTNLKEERRAIWQERFDNDTADLY